MNNLTCLAFHDIQVDTCSGDVIRHGTVHNRLTPRAVRLLQRLAASQGEVVQKTDLLAAVWRDVVVCEASLKVCIREIRLKLGDNARNPCIIDTVHRRGYRFLPALQACVPTASENVHRPSDRQVNRDKSGKSSVTDRNC